VRTCLNMTTARYPSIHEVKSRTTPRPILGAVGFMKGARITKRYGPPEDGVREFVVDLGS
jgi:hypothetical protein